MRNSSQRVNTHRNMSKIDRPKLFMDIAKQNFVLTRIDDGKQIPCAVVKFVEWNEDGTFRAAHDMPLAGRSIIVDPGPYGQYRWMTSTIKEVVSDTEFKTNNSTYTLHKV